jgi:preprotein translocase subunit SecG
MTIILTIIHVIVCFFLIVVVLLQSGKAADLAGAFGGMGSQTAFGPRGSATLLSKATTLAAAIFMVTSLSLAVLATRSAGSSGSILEKVKAPANKTAPATPAAPQSSAPVTLPPVQQKPAEAPAPANKK